jgi:hypothetical protein
VRTAAPSSTLKKAVVLLLDRTPVKGYLNPTLLGHADQVDLLTSAGEHRAIQLTDIKSVYFVREFTEPFELERKIFLSRPKLDGLWVRMRFCDEDIVEGIVGNNLLDLLDSGAQITPPDIHGNTLRMFVPRSALVEMKVLGVVGIARRTPQEPGKKVTAAQSKLFGE